MGRRVGREWGGFVLSSAANFICGCTRPLGRRSVYNGAESVKAPIFLKGCLAVDQKEQPGQKVEMCFWPSSKMETLRFIIFSARPMAEAKQPLLLIDVSGLQLKLQMLRALSLQSSRHIC